MADDMQSLARKLVGPLMPWIVDRIPIVSGTWTPAFAGTTIAGSFTYAAQLGRYTRVGNQVIIHAYVQISAIGVAPTGNMQITGIPIHIGQCGHGL